MFSIIKDWKAYRIYLPDLAAWLTTNIGENYKGMSADTVLTFWFDEEPTEQQKTDIDAQWNGTVEQDEDAKWSLYDARGAIVGTARTALLTADLTTTIPAERKLLMNMPLSNDDKDALITKYS